MMPRTRMPAALLAAAISVAACGGKVIIDGSASAGSGGSGSGQGGFGGTRVTGPSSVGVGAFGTGGTTSVSTNTGAASNVGSVSTGPTTCPCIDACAELASCGAVGDHCAAECSSGDPFFSCVCNAGSDCSAVLSCFPGGAGQPHFCKKCEKDAEDNACEDAFDECHDEPSCKHLRSCQKDCDWAPHCMVACMNAYPTSVAKMKHQLDCSVCSSCSSTCKGSDIYDMYCL